MSLRAKEGKGEGNGRCFSVSGRLGSLGVPFPALVWRRGNEKLCAMRSVQASAPQYARKTAEVELADAPCKS